MERNEKNGHKSQLQVTNLPLLEESLSKKLSGWGLEAVSIRAGLTGMKKVHRRTVPVMGGLSMTEQCPELKGKT